MKILFLTERSDNNVGVFNYHGLELAVGELADCKWAGEGWPLHKTGESPLETVNRVMHDADWVVCPRETLIDAKKIRARTCIMVTDLHGKWNWGLKTADQFVDALKSAGYDIVFSRYREVHGTPSSPKIFQEALGERFRWLPWSMDEDYYFRFRGETEYDVLFAGSQHAQIYPLRHSMFNGLFELCVNNDLRLYKKSGIGIPPWKAKISELEKKGYPVGKNYARLLGTSRATLFGNSKFRYPLQKNFEVRAAGSLVVSDAPVGAEELGFKAGVDYVKVSIGSWRTELLYYLNNWSEGMKIANAGRKVFLERHTHRIRAKQLVAELMK